jgi:hypothetical protein
MNEQKLNTLFWASAICCGPMKALACARSSISIATGHSLTMCG